MGSVPWLRPSTLLLMLGLTLVSVALTLRMQSRLPDMEPPPIPPDRLTVDDFVLGVLLEVGSAPAPLRLSPAQAQRLLKHFPAFEHEMYGLPARPRALAVFRHVLSEGQAGRIRDAAWRRQGRLVDPQGALRRLRRLLVRRAAEGA